MTVIRMLALALVGALSLAAGPAPRGNWNAMIAATPAGGYRVGNPAAKVKLVEYVSYTCPHCAEFEIQGTDRIRLAYVASGKVSYEVRNFVRDPIDLTVALLATCGAPSKFYLNHAAFLRSQPTWIKPLQRASQASLDRWMKTPDPQRRRFIASDFKFYEIAATRGIDRNTADRCLADDARARVLANNTKAADDAGVSGTPSFSLNGTLLIGTHDWSTLQPQLDAAL